MNLPTNIREALLASPHSGEGSTDIDCAGAKFHSPTPLLVQSVKLRDGSYEYLCGTCRDNLDVLWHLLDEAGGTLPWPVRREFGNLIRALALRGTDGG